MLRLYIIGFCVLFIAIIANVIISKIGLMTWYDFGPAFLNKGFLFIKEIGVLNLIWLFVLYPLVLSLGCLIGDNIYHLIK